jgi:hypothetical protein
VIHKILDELDWCTNNAYSQDLTDNIGRCILKAAKLPCVNTASVRILLCFYLKEN